MSVLLDDGSHMQTGNLRAAFVVIENNAVTAFRTYRCVVRGRHRIFPTITGSDHKRVKRRMVKKFSNAGNHEGILSLNGISFKTEVGRNGVSQAIAFPNRVWEREAEIQPDNK